MGQEYRINFDPFSLDLINECLWRGAQAIKLRPKAFALLHYLVKRPGRLITKEELLNAVWPETFVGEAVLKVTVAQLREALADDSRSPRYIETVHRRGYRFVGEIKEHEQRPAGDPKVRSNTVLSGSLPHATGSLQKFVGRGDALSRMRRWLGKVLTGKRQVVFITGEAGIGKTSLIDAFAQRIAADQSILISRGQCLEQYGTSEAYLPVLEAIGRLCREHPQVVEVLRAHAPMWLLQLPSLVNSADRESLSREMLGATRERMLREMSEALEALTAERPLVLILEDLHWSDYSTLDLISYLARQRQAARLMLIGTYRAAELVVSGHPLKAVKQELLAKQQCEELPLDYLSEAAVAAYLSIRFPANPFQTELARLVHERTEGNPLFMVNMVDYLAAEGFVVESDAGWQLATAIEEFELGVPDTIKQLISRQLDHLGAEMQRTLEAASVAGAEFSMLAVVAGLEEDRAAVEARCEELARQHLIICDCGVNELPTQGVVTRYGFVHALYQNVLYDRMPAFRRMQLHRRIAERGEEIYGERVREIAAELAMHFERAGDYKQAAKYIQQAADNDIRRFAYQDAVRLARQGLRLLERLPDTRERAQQELCLQLTLGVPLIAIEGYAAVQVGSVYLRARELTQQLGDSPDVSEALWGLWTFYTLRAEFGTARTLAEEYLLLAERLPYPGLALRAHWAMEITSMHLGEFASALEHFERALSLYDPKNHRDDGFLYALNPGVAMPCFAAWALWFLGQPEQALHRIREALALARDLSEPLGLAHALFFASALHQLRREARLTRDLAEAAIAVSSEHGLVMYQAMAMIMRGWALIELGSEEGAIAQMRQGLADLQATSTRLVRPHFLALLAEALNKTQKIDEGRRVLEEALRLVHHTGERCYEAELYRLKGELIIQANCGNLSRAATGGQTMVETIPLALAQAEDDFDQAIKTAQRQEAKSLELRTAMSIARLYQKRGMQEEARRLLSQTYSRFTEGFDTADLREAKALLDQLS